MVTLGTRKSPFSLGRCFKEGEGEPKGCHVIYCTRISTSYVFGVGGRKHEEQKWIKTQLIQEICLHLLLFILYFLHLLEGKSQPHKIDGGDQGETKGKVGVSFIPSWVGPSSHMEFANYFHYVQILGDKSWHG